MLQIITHLKPLLFTPTLFTGSNNVLIFITFQQKVKHRVANTSLTILPIFYFYAYNSFLFN